MTATMPGLHDNELRLHNERIHEFLNVATHELQSPLWSILGFVAKLRRRCGQSLDDEARHCLDRIDANVLDMHKLIGEMASLLTVTPEQLDLGPVDIAAVLRDVAGQVQHDVDARFECRIEAAEPFPVWADAHQLRQLLMALARNAALYVRPGEAGRLTLRTRSESAQPSPGAPARLHVYLEDRGIGIEPRYREVVFRPMERLLDVEAPGRGMGLTLARRIAEAHGGTLTIEDPVSSPGAQSGSCALGSGVCLHLVLPIPATADPMEGNL